MLVQSDACADSVYQALFSPSNSIIDNIYDSIQAAWPGTRLPNDMWTAEATRTYGLVWRSHTLSSANARRVWGHVMYGLVQVSRIQGKRMNMINNA